MKLLKSLITTALIAVSAFMFAAPVSAATVKSLEAGTTYTTLDFNNDGKNDTFKIEPYDRNNGGDIYFVLNGKRTAVFVARGCGVTYYKYNKSNVYLIVYSHLYGGGSISIYRYSGSTLKCVKQNADVLARNLFKKASGAVVSIATSPYHQDQIAPFKRVSLSNYRVTTFIAKYKLNPSTHKFSLGSRYLNAAGTYYITYSGASFRTSSNAVTLNKKGMLLKSGMKVKLTKMYIKPYKTSEGILLYRLRFKVQSGKKYGWFAESAAVSFH